MTAALDKVKRHPSFAWRSEADHKALAKEFTDHELVKRKFEHLLEMRDMEDIQQKSGRTARAFYLPVKLFLSKLNREPSRNNKLFTPLLLYMFAPLHVGLIIGDVVVEWYDSGLVVPTIVPAPGAGTCMTYEGETVDYMQEATRKMSLAHQQYLDVPQKLGIIYWSRDEMEGLLDQLVDVIVDYNSRRKYNAVSCNCQHFVKDTLQALKIKKIPESVIPKFEGNLKAYIEGLQGGKPKMVSFTSHAELDRYVEKNREFLNTQEKEYCVCKYFEFHAKEIAEVTREEQERWICPVHGCLCNDLEEEIANDSLYFYEFQKQRKLETKQRPAVANIHEPKDVEVLCIKRQKVQCTTYEGVIISQKEGNCEKVEASSQSDSTTGGKSKDEADTDTVPFTESYSPDPAKGSKTMKDFKRLSTLTKKIPKGSHKVKVFLLDGRSIDLDAEHKETIETVVDSAHMESQTLDLDFFSVYFYDDYICEHHGQDHLFHQKIFLTPGKRLRAHYSVAEKKILKEPWEYQYGVKYYVPDPNNSRLLKDVHSRYLMCLQLCDDIRSDRVHVDTETAIRLTAIMLQGKLGDYEEDSHLPGYYQEFSQFQLLPDSLKPDSYEAQLIQEHKAKAGYVPSQCDAEFLSIAKDLKHYGEHLFLTKSHRNGSLKHCRMMTIGNGCKGVSMYCEGEEDIHVPWKDVVKISYKRDRFRASCIVSLDTTTMRSGMISNFIKPALITNKIMLYHLGYDNLNTKYRGYEGKIKSYSKAIADYARVNIKVEVNHDKAVQWIIWGKQPEGMDKALEMIKQQFKFSEIYLKAPVVEFLSESNQRKLMKYSVETGVPLLTTEALHYHDILTDITEVRQFSCRPCEHSWWAFGLRTKAVSECTKCYVLYDALERSREFGIGRFICIMCDHNFYAWCTAVDKLRCFMCHELIGPPYINPRFNFRVSTCRLRYEVSNYSTPHDSTGSTEDTIETQDFGPDVIVERCDNCEVLDCGTISPRHATDEEDFNSDSDTSDGGDADLYAIADELSDFEQDSGDELSEADETEPNTTCDSRGRKEALHSDSSDDKGKGSVKSAKDSGIGTLSITGTGSDVNAENIATHLSVCSFYPEFPGVAFSKTSNEGILSFNGGEIICTGIKLTIPQGAIRRGESINMSLRTCIGGPFYLPKGYKFVSPVFLAQPSFTFHKDVILKMEIFAEVEKEELVFVTSPSKPDIVKDKAEWKFKAATRKPKLNAGNNFGVIHLKHFCFFSFAGRSAAKMKYWSLYYNPKSFNSSCLCHVIFSVSIASKVYKENLWRFLRDQYKNEAFDIESKFISFSSDSVSIIVGDVEQKEYKVCPTSQPCKIFMKDLHIYKKKKKAAKDYAAYPPRIVLKIVQEPTATSTFMHTLKVDGIPTIESLNILIQPTSDMRPQQLRQASDGSGVSVSSSAICLQDSASSRSSSRQQLDNFSGSRCTEPVIPTMKDLMKYLHPIAPKWKMLGVNLEMDMGTIRTVEKDRDSAEDCLLELLGRWEDAVNPELRNWETIYKAVREPSLGSSKVADVIKTKFLS